VGYVWISAESRNENAGGLRGRKEQLTCISYNPIKNDYITS